MALSLPSLLLLSAWGCAGTDGQALPGGDDTGDSGSSSVPTDGDGDGWFTPEDCNDYDEGIHPEATEVCDGLDNDCDGNVDVNEAVDTVPFFQDGDDDGYGDATRSVQACSQPPGFVADGTDCDDTDPTTHPGAPEVCNDGADNNCNGDAQECAATGDRALPTADATWAGVAGGDQAGFALAPAGDVNGDGMDDVIVGAPYADAGTSNAGAAYLVLGPALGSRSLAGDAAWLGTVVSENAGTAVSGAGDLDGDGYDDVLVGSTHADLNGNDSGGVYVVMGPGLGEHRLAGEASFVYEGEESYDALGFGLGGGRDLTGDGVLDLVFGATGHGDGSAQSRGRVYVVAGPPSAGFDLELSAARVDGAEAYDRLGQVAVLDDTDGDGVADLALGAATWPGNDATGGVFVYRGPLSGALLLADADAVLEGEQAGGQAGFVLGAAGDLDGDGKADLVVGAPYADGEASEGGVAYGVLGPMVSGSLLAAPLRISGTEDRANLGYSVAGGGDSDADGRDDLLVGAKLADANGTDAGAAYLFYSPDAGALLPADAGLRLLAGAARDEAGAAAAFAGNVNGDCCSDLVIGATQVDAGGEASGGVYLLLGAGI